MAARKSGEALVYKRTAIPKINELDPTDNPSFGDMWIDISVNPPVVKVLDQLLAAVTINATLTPPVTITGTNPGTVPLTIVGAASQTSDLLDVKTNSATVLTVGASGGLSLSQTIDGVGLTISTAASGATSDAVQVFGRASDNADFRIRWSPTTTGSFVRVYGGTTVGTTDLLLIASGSSTGNLLNLQNVTPTSVFKIDIHGNSSFGDNTAAPTVGAGQIGLGATTATSATAGVNGAVPAQVVGYWIVNIAGTSRKIPFFAT